MYVYTLFLWRCLFSGVVQPNPMQLCYNYVHHTLHDYCAQSITSLLDSKLYSQIFIIQHLLGHKNYFIIWSFGQGLAIPPWKNGLIK